MSENTEVNEATRPHNKKRIYGLIVVVLFVAGGFLLFGNSVPREVQIRFDLPPVSRSAFAEIPRARVALVTANIINATGERVATINLPVPNGLVGPRTGPAVLRLTPGTYAVRAKVRSFEAAEIPLDGRFELDGDEVVVELK